MNSKERILNTINGEDVDHLPMTTWSFGFQPPEHLAWETNGEKIKYWYTGRQEHYHNFPYPWDFVVDDLKRVDALLSLGIDDVLEVSVPWSIHPDVTWEDSVIPANDKNEHPIMVRQYQTPAGPLRHAVTQTQEDIPEGWVTSFDYVPLIDDQNIPRGVDHAVSSPEDVDKIKYLYAPPAVKEKAWMEARMKKIKAAADERGVFVQAWTAFGMDAAVWFGGTEGAILMAMDEPEAFDRLLDVIFKADYGRTELALKTPGVDMVCQRGWYSSIEFWSPDMFDQFVFPRVKALADLAHKHEKKFGYVMTTGVEVLGSRLADAGVDVLFFIDPVQDKIPLEKARDVLGGQMTLVGGTNSLSLSMGNESRIRKEVKDAIDILGPTKRFILHPIDALFPDTPWEKLECMIDAWKEYR